MYTEKQILEFFEGRGLIPTDKHEVILKYGKKYDCDTFIETGTENGDTIEAVKDYFSKVYSIELGPNYYLAAVKRFKTDSNVCILWGDSGDVLNTFLPIIRGRKNLFYLDAHWKYDSITPKNSNSTIKELEAIFSFTRDSIILIDDARTFTGVNDQGQSCPRLNELEAYVLSKGFTFEIKNDIIRIQ